MVCVQYKTEKDGVIETRIEKRLVLTGTGSDIDHDQVTRRHFDDPQGSSFSQRVPAFLWFLLFQLSRAAITQLTPGIFSPLK